MWQKQRRLVTPRGCEWIRPLLKPSNTWFLGPTLVNPTTNGISIGSAVFGQYVDILEPHTQTDKQTDHATYDIIL